MASWMVHLRIADRLLNLWPELSATEFVMGSIAPDSGVPTGPVGVYMPDKTISHFQERSADGEKRIRADWFAQQYLTAEQRACCTAAQHSFYLGYYVHLLTDIRWVEEIFRPSAQAEGQRFAANRSECILRWKEDWYDLDFLYLQQHPGLRAFEIYKDAKGFVNDYLNIFSPTAFDERRQGVADFYAQTVTGLDREYPYLTKERMDRFVEESVVTIARQLTETALCEPLIAKNREDGTAHCGKSIAASDGSRRCPESCPL